jgi:hypothetical protein
LVQSWNTGVPPLQHAKLPPMPGASSPFAFQILSENCVAELVIEERLEPFTALRMLHFAGNIHLAVQHIARCKSALLRSDAPLDEIVIKIFAPWKITSQEPDPERFKMRIAPVALRRTFILAVACRFVRRRWPRFEQRKNGDLEKFHAFRLLAHGRVMARLSDFSAN